MTPTKLSISIVQVKLPAVHPGEILGDELAEINVTLSDFARAVDLRESQIAEIIEGHMAVSADAAFRLGKYFGTSARFWLNLQTKYDLATERAETSE